MPIFGEGLLTQQDYLQIENRLYSPRLEEMVLRDTFDTVSGYSPDAREIGYDWYTGEGSAIILAHGAGAKDIRAVSEKGGRETVLVFDGAIGIDFTKAEIRAMAEKRQLGKGPAVNIETLRVDRARRFLLELEQIMNFTGKAPSSQDGSSATPWQPNLVQWCKGIFDASFYGTDAKGNPLGTAETVASTGSGGDTKMWSTKTPPEILADLWRGMSVVENTGLFQAKVLLLPPTGLNQLRLPYSTLNLTTIMEWLNSQGMYFEKIIKTRALAAPYNGDTVDWFMVCDNDPEVIQLGTVQDIELGPQVLDKLGNVEMAATMRLAGPILRHPQAFYIGKGIG